MESIERLNSQLQGEWAGNGVQCGCILAALSLRPHAVKLPAQAGVPKSYLPQPLAPHSSSVPSSQSRPRRVCMYVFIVLSSQ